ncbi:hypothetical protein GGH94_005447 [Coemansia aciculifera]|uniref:AB hydrolase-1 domain-containing protein n=1 Tax=Coemansia aciculifera TaxID=417176 RepID=A0A9W8M4A5_9FUNG|nr:hypothetical protein GGH94_005447 [Coemansia aciculifera]
MFKKNSTPSLADTKQFQPPWLLHAAASRSGILSLSKLWPWGIIDTRTQNTQEHELLAQGGITVVGSSITPNTETSGRSPVLAEIMDVDIDSHGNYIHTLVIRNGGKTVEAEAQPRHNLVMTHGYFTGVGFFYRNYYDLSKVEGWDIYSIDWLGMGRSSRPTYKGCRAEGEDKRVSHAEEFFVESLEEWRKRMGIEKMTLCGHSFGGYMNSVYALKYPQHVEKLVLVSPIGLPEAPPDLEERMRNGYAPSNTDKPKGSEPESDPSKPSMQRVLLFRTAMSLWDRNYTPQWLVRSTGPFSRRLIDWYIGRFSLLTEEQRRGMAAYSHQIAMLPESSASALGDILRPGAFARRPLVGRLSAISVPTTFMYGSHDWVEHTGGLEVIRRIGGRVATHLYRVPNAGHNMHIDNPADFNRFLVSEMKGVRA